MKLIAFTETDGTIIRLNAYHISCVKPNNGQFNRLAKTIILMSNGSQYGVKEGMDEMELIA